MIRGIEHIGLCADEPTRLMEWYVNLLGFRVVRAADAKRTYFLRAPDGRMLEIYPSKHPTASESNAHRGLRHIALSAVDLDGELVRLRTAGVDVLADTVVTTPEMKLAFFRDPEGNLLHLVERAEEIP